MFIKRINIYISPKESSSSKLANSKLHVGRAGMTNGKNHKVTKALNIVKKRDSGSAGPANEEDEVEGGARVLDIKARHDHK